MPIGGDDTLSYAVRLHQEGVPVVGIPKTMDNDVNGTDYCIGFSTAVTRSDSIRTRMPGSGRLNAAALRFEELARTTSRASISTCRWAS